MPLGTRVALAPLFLLAALGACMDLTRPEPPVTLLVTADPGPAVIEDLYEGPRITCPVKLGVAVSGSGNAIVRRAVFNFYMGIDTLAAVDSMVLVGSQLGELWGNALLAPGDAKSADWHFWADAPFQLEFVVHYEQSGTSRTDSARTRFTCGARAPAGTAPPAIMEALLDPKLQQYEVGDTVAIRYTATSTAGVWRSAVGLAGAFEQQQVFSERGSASVRRTAKFVVPAGARLDEPLHISVYAEDVGLQVAARHLPAAARIVDVTPPTLTSMTVYSGSWIDRRQAAVGDEIRLVAAARDDHALTWLVYELGAPANVRDSVPLAAGGASSDTWTAILTAKPEWLGAFPLSAYVRDAAGHRSEVLDAGELRVYPVVERVTSAVLDVPTGFAPAIEDVAYDAGRDLMYLAQPGTRSVQRLVVGAMAFDAPLTFDERLGGVALALSADSLLVTLPESRRIAVLDIPDGQRTYVGLSVLDTAGTDGSVSPLPPQPTSVRVTASGKALVPLTHGTRSNVHVLEVDLATGAHRLRPDAGARGFGQYHASARFGLTPDRSRLVMLPAYACAQVYIAVSDSFTPCSPPIDGSPGLSFMSFDAAGAQLTFSNRVLDASLREVRRVPMRFSPPSPISLSGGGEVVYVPTSGGIDVMRIADGIFVERISVPVEVSRLFVGPDGSWLIAFTDSMEPKLVRVSLR